MEVLHLIHSLREDCLKAGGSVSGVDLQTLHQWEKQVLKGIADLRSFQGQSHQSPGFISYLKEEGLEALIPFYFKKYPESEAVKPPPVKSPVPVQNFTPVVPQTLEEPGQPSQPGFLERAWDYFRDELTINWFLFLGAFMVFAAGLFYSLVWWDDFLPAQKYGLSLGVLLFAAVMEIVLKQGMNLQKSPQIFMGIYAAFLPLVLMVHAKISGLGFLVTFMLGLCINYRLYHVYARASFWSVYGLATLFLSIYLVASLPVDVSKPMAVMVLAGLGTVYYLFARLPNEHIAVRTLGAWVYLVTHFLIMSPLVFVWVLFVLMLVQSLHTERTKNLQSFVYGSYLMIAIISLLVRDMHILHLATLFFSIRLHLLNFESPHPVRIQFMVLITGLWILAIPLVYEVLVPVLFEALAVLYTTYAIFKSGGTGLGWIHLILYLCAESQIMTQTTGSELRACLFGIPPLLIAMRHSSGFWPAWDMLFGSLIICAGFSFSGLWMALLFMVLGVVFTRRFSEFNPFVRLSELYLVLVALEIVWRYTHIHIWQTGVLLILSVFLLFLDHYRYSRPIAFICMQIAGIVLAQKYYATQPQLFMQYWQILVFLIQCPLILQSISKWGLPRDLSTNRQDFIVLMLVYVSLMVGLMFCIVSPQYLISGLVLCLIYGQDLAFFSQIIAIFIRLAHLHGVVAVIYTTQVMALGFAILGKLRLKQRFFLKIHWFESISLILGLCIYLESTLAQGEDLRIFGIYAVLSLALAFWFKTEYRLLYLILAQMALLFPHGGFIAVLLILSTSLYLLGIFFWKGQSRSLVLMVANILNVTHYAATIGTPDFSLGILIPAAILFVYFLIRPLQSLLILGLILLLISLANLTTLYLIGPAFYLVAFVLHRFRHRGAHIVLLFTGIHLMTFSVIAVSESHEAGAIFALATLSIYFMHMALLRQMEILVYCGFISLAFLLMLLRLWGYIGGHGMLSYVLLFSSLMLNIISPRLSGAYNIFCRPLEKLRDVLPIVVLLIEIIRQDAPIPLLFTALVLEYYHREEAFSYRRLAALFAFNAALFLWARPSGLFLEVMSLCSGISILWYAHTIRNQISMENLRVLTVLGNLVFYSGGVYDFVLNSSIHSLLILWGFSFLGGWLALLFKARIQLFSSLGIFLMSLIFFVIRQLMDQVSVGIPLVAFIGIVLIVIGVILEKNREKIQAWFSRFEAYLKDWQS